MAYTLEELRQCTDEDLIREHDSNTKNYPEGPYQIREELARRKAQSQGKLMVRLTVVITFLTVMITILTAANVYLVLQA